MWCTASMPPPFLSARTPNLRSKQENVQHLPNSPKPPVFWVGEGVLFHACIEAAEVNAEMQAAILLPYQYHCITPCTLAKPDSTRLQHLLQVASTSSTNSGGICLNCFLKGVSSVTFIVCMVEWVQPNSARSNKNTSWYSARSWQAASTSSGGQESNPLKSNSLNNFPCLCLTVNLGV